MRRAIICGSGVAGLSAAIALGRKGWSVDVYERSHAVREIGAGIFLKGMRSGYSMTSRCSIEFGGTASFCRKRVPSTGPAACCNDGSCAK